MAPTINVEMTADLHKIRFLDLLLRKHTGGRLSYEVGFKPTDSHTLLGTTSYHPSHVFRSILFGQVYRWATHCSSYDAFKKTKALVQPALRRQGYSRSAIRKSVRRTLALTGQNPRDWSNGFFPCGCDVCSYSSFTNVIHNECNRNLFLILHKLSCLTSGVIYLITCKKCSQRYVGQSSRQLRERISEHLRNISHGYPTSVSLHFLECGLENFSFAGIEHCPNPKKRLTKESLWIKRLRTLRPHGMNERLHRPTDLPLVLPFSRCSQRVLRCVQKAAKDYDVCASFRRHKNLSSILTNKRHASFVNDG